MAGGKTHLLLPGKTLENADLPELDRVKTALMYLSANSTFILLRN